MVVRRSLQVLTAVAILGCWLSCATEIEAHQGTDVQPCVTCCANHQVLPPSSGLRMALPEGVAIADLGLTTDLYDQTVVRLPDPPPKFTA
jgi:hypothetical protein